MLVFSAQTRLWCSKQEPFRVLLLPLVPPPPPPNDRNCLLQMRVVKKHVALSHTFNIGVFESG